MSDVVIRPFGPQDAASVARLMIEIQQHYGAPHPPPPQIEAQLTSLPAGVEILLADGIGTLVGLAAFSTIFPGPGISGGLFLKDLYVSASDRGRGIGLALMKALASIASERGLGRIDWTVAKDNVEAVAFYDMLGGAPQPGRHFYRLSGSALSDLARGSQTSASG